MAYQVLARKYRPQNFSEVIGQDHVTRTLKNALEQQRIAHGYIFSGHRGIGKTTIARILAMALNCRSNDKPVAEPCGKCESCTEVRAGNAVDVIEIDAATNRGIDEIRELREAARYRPARDRFKIYILDEAHQITDAAFNALLKTLEEPPGHIVFMMATTQPEDIPQTIRSRCQHFSFHAVKFDDIVKQLSDIAKQEGIQADKEAVAVLAEAGDGSMRDALSIMDQAIACCGTTIGADTVRGLVGTVSSETLEAVMNAVAGDDSAGVLQIVDKLVTEGQSPAHFARQFVRFLRNALMAKVAGNDSSLLQISSDERARVGRVAALFGEEDLTRFMNIALRTYDELGYRQEQRFHLELGILKMVHAQRLLPLEELLSGQPTGAPSSKTTSSPAPRAIPPPVSRSAAPVPASVVSPFDADRARKTRLPEAAGSSSTSIQAASTPDPTPAKAAIATAIAAVAVAAAQQQQVEIEPEPPLAPATSDVNELRASVIEALESASQGMLATMLDTEDWSLNGNEITVKVPKSQVMIEMSFGAEAKKLVTAALSKAAGRPLKISVVSGGTGAAPAQPHRSTARAATGSARARAADDPIVQYMQKKFGAEIRTVIDHTKKD